MKFLNTRKRNINNMISGALFDFMGYLTTRKNVIHVGSTETVSQILDAFEEWCLSRKLDSSNPDVENWESKI